MGGRAWLLLLLGLGGCPGWEAPEPAGEPNVDDAGLQHGELHDSVSWKCTCNVFKITPPNEPITSVKPVATFEAEPICIGQQGHAADLATAASCAAYPDMNCGCSCCATYAPCRTTALDECLTRRGIEISICSMADIDRGGYRCKLEP